MNPNEQFLASLDDVENFLETLEDILIEAIETDGNSDILGIHWTDGESKKSLYISEFIETLVEVHYFNSDSLAEPPFPFITVEIFDCSVEEFLDYLGF